MPNRRLSLRKIKEVLRLKFDCGISEREISRSCQVSRSTVVDYLRRVAAAKLTWTEASVLAETHLESRLFPTEHIPSSVKRPPPDCEYIYNQLRTYRKFNLTLSREGYHVDLSANIPLEMEGKPSAYDMVFSPSGEEDKGDKGHEVTNKGTYSLTPLLP